MEKYTQQTAAQMEKILKTSATMGLSGAAAAKKQQQGKNQIFPDTRASFGKFLKLWACRISSYVMIGALVLAFFMLHWIVALTVTLAYGAFLAIAYLMFRYRQKRLFELYRISSANVRVVRDGREVLLNPEDLVVGDLMLLCAGDVLYADAYVITEEEMDVFCTRGEIREARLKHGGACFQSTSEPFNLLRTGDVIRLGEGRAFVTGVSDTPPLPSKQLSLTEKRQNKICRIGVLLSAAVLALTLVLAYFTTESISDFMRVALCSSMVLALSPVAWNRLLYECMFLSVNKTLSQKQHVAFSSMHAVENAVDGSCFLLSTRSVFQGSRFVVRAFESGTGIHVSERSSRSTPELSLISKALFTIHRENAEDSYEKYLLSFCRRHMEGAPALKLGAMAVSSENSDVSVASFTTDADGRAFSFVAGDPEFLLSYVLYASEGGRVRLLDNQTRAAILSSVQKMKKDGHKLVAYAETQTRVTDGTFPYLSRDLKLLGFFVLSELPDKRIANSLKWIAQSGRKAFFFHDGEDPSWITDELPLLKSAPVIDGNEFNLEEELTAFVTDINMPFAIGIHLTPQQRSRLAHMLADEGYVTVSHGTSYADHRLLCAADVSMAPIPSRGVPSVGIVQESASIYTKEHVGAQVSAVREAKEIVSAFEMSSTYLCASLLARSVLLLLGSLFGTLFLGVLALFVLSLFDLLAFWCLCRVHPKVSANSVDARPTVQKTELFAGVLSASLLAGALAMWMMAVPADFRFSYTAFCFVSLLLVLNVCVLRYTYVRLAALLPFLSVGISALFLWAESVSRGYPWIASDFPFWVLLPTVALIAVGKLIEIRAWGGKDDESGNDTEEIQEGNNESIDKGEQTL